MGWKVFLGVFGSELFKTGFPNRENFSCFPPVCFTIPRHAAGREAASTQFDPKNDLPGGINMAFADNHVELVRLERLWNLTWHRSWAAPAKRPGKGSILSSAHAVISLITFVGGHDYLPPR